MGHHLSEFDSNIWVCITLSNSNPKNPDSYFCDDDLFSHVRSVSEATWAGPVAGGGQRQGGLGRHEGRPQARGLHHQHQRQDGVPPQARGGLQAHQDVGTGLCCHDDHELLELSVYRLSIWMLRGITARGCFTAMGYISTASTFFLRTIGNQSH